jgi:hypothetical protein
VFGIGDEDVQVRQSGLMPILGAFALAAAMIGAAAPASADDSPAVGSNCASGQVGDSATTGDGAVVRCLATEAGGFSWSADTGAAGTIADLEQQGYNVTMDRVGNGALSACRVTDVRNPITTTRIDRNARADQPETIVLNKTVNVSLDCTGG